MNQSVGWHTRNWHNSNDKFEGGSKQGDFSLATANDIAGMFSVEVLPTGNPVFVDKHGRRVWLYMTIDPAQTEVGRKALADWTKMEITRRRLAQEREEAQRKQLEQLIETVGLDEALRRLSENAS